LPHYQIAGVNIHLANHTNGRYDGMRKFVASEQEQVDLSLMVRMSGHIEPPAGKLIYEHEAGSLQWNESSVQLGGYCLSVKYLSTGEIAIAVEIAQDWRSALAVCRDYSHDGGETVYIDEARLWSELHSLLGMVFCYHLLLHKGVVVHASAVKHREQGIIFSAPSGTGKSTQAMLWQTHVEHSVILNDDTPAIRFLEGRPHVFGTPWSGSSGIYCDESVPLTAVILLEQSKVNQISQISVQQALPLFLPRFFLPYFDQGMMDEALSVCDALLDSVPVYLLRCRPDLGAVEAVKQLIA